MKAEKTFTGDQTTFPSPSAWAYGTYDTGDPPKTASNPASHGGFDTGDPNPRHHHFICWLGV